MGRREDGAGVDAVRGAEEQVSALITNAAGRRRLLKEHQRAGLCGEEIASSSGRLYGGFATALRRENKMKNRYTDVLPFEETRVKLRGDKYINANWVVAGHAERHRRLTAFVATQAPLPTTEADFWDMCWQVRAERIVMLTQAVEEGSARKCHPYFVQDVGSRADHGAVTVRLCAEDELVAGALTRRRFVLAANGDGGGDGAGELTIEHFHFMGWPDHGVPSGTSEFLRLLFEARLVPRDAAHFAEYMAPQADAGPVVVHCSAGIGRTGTLCAVVMMLQEVIASGAFDEDLPEQTLKHLRTQRQGMVQRPEQYAFAVLALRDLLYTYHRRRA